MFERVMLALLKGRRKLEYIQKNSLLIGKREINGVNSVLYMLGSGFVEVIKIKGGKEEIKYYKNLQELNSYY